MTSFYNKLFLQMCQLIIVYEIINILSQNGCWMIEIPLPSAQHLVGHVANSFVVPLVNWKGDTSLIFWMLLILVPHVLNIIHL